MLSHSALCTIGPICILLWIHVCDGGFYRVQRPPGLVPSSMLGLESLTGELDEFGFEDFLNGN